LNGGKWRRGSRGVGDGKIDFSVENWLRMEMDFSVEENQAVE